MTDFFSPFFITLRPCNYTGFIDELETRFCLKVIQLLNVSRNDSLVGEEKNRWHPFLHFSNGGNVVKVEVYCST